MASDASVSSPDSSPSARRRAQPLFLGSGASTPSRLSAEAAAQLQVEHAGLNKRLERVNVERKGAEQRAHEKEEENHALRREKDELEHQLRRKQLEVDTLGTLNREQAAEHRGRYTALQVQASDLECQLSAQRSRIFELEEELRRGKSAAAREQELVAQLQRQEEQAVLAREASERERENRRQREKEMLQEHRERLKKQGDASLREQEKLRRSHSQAVEVQNLKITSLEQKLEDERSELQRQTKEVEERLGEYEEALDELERDHEAKVSFAAREARFQCEAEHAAMAAEIARCRENESRMRARVEDAELAQRQAVANAMAEWEDVYKELERLYFAARDEAQRKGELLKRTQRDLDVANETLSQVSEQQRTYTQNIEWLKERLDASRSDATPQRTPAGVHFAGSIVSESGNGGRGIPGRSMDMGSARKNIVSSLSTTLGD